MYIYVYIYIYTHTYTERERERKVPSVGALQPLPRARRPLPQRAPDAAPPPRSVPGHAGRQDAGPLKQKATNKT